MKEKIKLSPNFKKWLLPTFFFAAFLTVFYLFLKLLKPFLTPLILAVLLAVIFLPLYKKLLRVLRGRKRLAALLMCLLVIFIVVIPFAAFVFLLSEQALNFYQDIRAKIDTNYYQDLFAKNSWILERGQSEFKKYGFEFNLEKQRDSLLQLAQNVGLYMYNQAGVIIGNIFQAVFYFFVIIFLLYYFFKDSRQIAVTLMDLSPLPNKLELKLVQKVAQVGRAVFFGNIVTALVQGFLGGMGFFVFGLSNALFWGTVIAVFSLIPSVGVFIITVPASLFFFIQGKWVIGLIFLAYNVLLVGSIDNVLKPKLIESKINLHPLLVFIGVLGGMLAFGSLGIIYGPLIVTLFVSFVEIYREHFRAEAS